MSATPSDKNISPGATPPHFSEALKRAREIASKLTGKGLPSSALDSPLANKRLNETDEDERDNKKQNFSDPSLALAKAALASGQTPSSDGAIQVCVAPKALKTTIEFIVPGFKVGLIIGKNGETLKRLERMSDCRITFSPLTTSNPADMPERKVFVTGLPNDVDHCKRLVLEKINEGPPMVIAAGATPPPMPPGTVVPVQLPNGVSLQVPIHRDEKGTILPMEHLFVPNNKVGLIIGKGGETIKDLQDRSGSRVYIAPDASMTADFSTERFIAVSGTSEAIMIAKQLLEDVLEGRALGSSTEIGKITVSLVMPDELVGMVIGRKGDYFKWMMAETRCRITAEPPVSDGRPNREIVITGPPEGVAYAQALIHDKVSGCAHLDPSGTTYSITDPNLFTGYSMGINQMYAMPETMLGTGSVYSTGVSSYSPHSQTIDSGAIEQRSAKDNDLSASYSPTQNESGSPNASATSYLTNTVTPNQYTQDQLMSIFTYYKDYYLSAGLEIETAQSAALAAMTSAGIPYPTFLDQKDSLTLLSDQTHDKTCMSNVEVDPEQISTIDDQKNDSSHNKQNETETSHKLECLETNADLDHVDTSTDEASAVADIIAEGSTIGAVLEPNQKNDKDDSDHSNLSADLNLSESKLILS